MAEVGMQRDQTIVERLNTRRERKLTPQPDSWCPADEVLASYVEGGLSETTHQQFERHLALCDWCMERIGLVGRAADDALEAALPNLVLMRARKLVDATDPRWALTRAPVWLAAAAVLLVVGLVILQRQAPPGVDASPSSAVRHVDPLALNPDVLSAGEGISIAMQPGRLAWTPVNGTLYYEVLVVDEVGDLIWEAKVQEPEWLLPEGLQLARETRYFVRVEAYLSESQAVTSEFELMTAQEVR